MLGKAATHIRPLLRVPAHQPDLFTSNPSLLHHFQQQGIVAHGASQAASGSGGAAGGAGRSGYSGASSGGYTGHARAFLSLPQTHSDATSIGASSDEHKEKAAASRARQIALNGRVRREEATLPRTVSVRDRLTERQGSRQIRVLEIEPEEPQPRRSTIAYPAWAALPAETGRGAPVWIAGAAPRPVGTRAYSTQSIDKEVEYVSATPPPELQRLSHNNRVFQDLAGLDFARPSSVGQVRRNSTASAVRPDPESSPDQEADIAIYRALRNQNEDPAKLDRLMSYYLAPRDGSVEVDATLAEEFPLPAGYTAGTYNACLSILLNRRRRGESIGPILDTYNEMLSRDIVPTLMTSRLVVSALCAREEDISAASRRWEKVQNIEEYKSQNLGVQIPQQQSDIRAAEAIEAYQAEDNLASAINLWKTLTTYNKTQNNSAILNMSSDILSAAATAIGLPHETPIESLFPMIDNLMDGSQKAANFKPILQLFAAQGLNAKAYLAQIDEVIDIVTRNNTVAEREGPMADAFQAAIQAYIAAGADDKAQALYDRFTAEASSPQSKGRLSNAMAEGFAKRNELDRALEWINKSNSNRGYYAFFAVADGLIDAQRVPELLDIFRLNKETLASEGSASNWRPDELQLQLLWARLLHNANNSNDATVIDMTTEFLTTTTPRFDRVLVTEHIHQLIRFERWHDIPKVLLSFPAGSGKRHSSMLAYLLLDISQAAAPLADVLQSVRASARLGLDLREFVNSTAAESAAASQIVQRYLTARAEVAKASDLGLSPDAWFRVIECFVSMPTKRVEAGQSDGAFTALMTDLAELHGEQPEKTKYFEKSPIIFDLSTILSSRFGPESSRAMLLQGLGEAAAAYIPVSESEKAPTPDFTLPPTVDAGVAPPTNLQPPSAHTLHVSPQLVALIERLGFANGPSPAAVYDGVRTAITRENAVPSPAAIGRLIVALSRENDEAKVRELYSLAQVVLASCVPDPRAQAEAWCATEDAMIASCCNLGHLEQAGMHRARIIEAGFAPSADAYATMISSSRDSTDDALVARELFEESQRLGVVPNLYLYNTIISKLSKARKAEMAIELFNQMKAAGIRPSSVTYGAVINACCRVGDEQSATTLFEEMSKQPNFRPRVPPFNTMMQFHLQTSPSREKVLYYYDTMRAARVYPSAHTYKILLDTYGTLAPIDLKRMERVFNELCSNPKVQVQGTHWASLITAFGMYGENKAKAMSVFESIPDHGSTHGKTLEPVVWEAALNVVGQKGTLEELEALHKRMVDSGARQTAYVCNVVINGYSRQGAIERAREVFEGMADSQTGVAAPNNHPALLTSSGHAKPLTTLPTDVIYREPSTYEAMVRAEVAAGDKERAAQVLKRMEERRYPVAVWLKAQAILDEAA